MPRPRGRPAPAATAAAPAARSAAPATGWMPAAPRSRGSKPSACRRSTVDLVLTRRDRQDDLEQEAVELGLGQGVGALVLDGVLGGGDHERHGQRAGRPRRPTTWRSSIASSREDWVFGGVRLISSASRRLVKTGPSRKGKSLVRASKTSEPVMSPGMRSGVNCTRLVSIDRAAARVRTSRVLATPGTPSSRMWPRASRAMSRPATAASWPTTALATSARTASRASRASGAGGRGHHWRVRRRRAGGGDLASGATGRSCGRASFSRSASCCASRAGSGSSVTVAGPNRG